MAKVIIGLLGFLAAVNLLALDYWLLKGREPDFPAKPVVADRCGVECQRQIEEKVASRVAQLVIPVLVPTQTVAPKSGLVPEPEVKIVVIPLTSSGETVATTWTEVVPSEFYFALTDYSGSKEVRLEAYLRAEHGGAKVFTRLYDATNNRGVDYSDLETQSSTYARVESSGLSIWRGNNKYVLQLKSANGTKAQLKDARLKLLF